MEEAYLGVDIGSISTKGVIIDKNYKILASEYIWTEGDPMGAARKLIELLEKQFDKEKYQIVATGTTGSARKLVGAMLGATMVKNEITAHAVGTTTLYPDVRTILEIGGQDSKIILVENGVAVDYAMNTLCAAGTGSFLSSQAKRLGVEVEDFGKIALTSKHPTQLAARCTVFAESDLVHKIQMGHTKEDIIAGLCRSVVNNYLNNVGKGKKIVSPIVFQGGVSKNIGVVEAFKKALGCDIIVDENGHLMGALGIAILAGKGNKKKVFDFSVEDMVFKTREINCGRCPNNCEIICVYRDDMLIDSWGNRCDKGALKAGTRTGNEITKSYGRFHDTPARRRTADRRRPAGKAVPDADRGLQHHAARKEEKRRHRGLIFVHAAPPRDYGSFMDPIYGRPGTDRPDGHAGSDLRNLPAALRRLDARSGTTVRPQLKITKDNAMKIICIARNYAAHAEELDRQVGGGTPCPPEPAWFLKPDTALLRNNDPFYIPAFSQEVHYECELVVRINRVGKGIAERFAHRYYDQVGLGIDFTARDLQRQAIAEGLPWERCKAFDRSAALSPRFVPLQELGGDVQSLHFTLEVNGQTRQRGDTSGMLFSVDRIIASVSQYMTLRMGDLLYTGTPAGVGPVRPGDNLRAVLEGRELLNFDIR